MTKNHSVNIDINEEEMEEGVQKYILMRLNKQLFGMLVNTIEDILLPQKITPIPLAPFEVKGALNLRGRIVTAIDLGKKLQMSDYQYDPKKHKNVVVEHNSNLYSLIVDDVSDVMNVADEDVEKTPENLSESWKDISAGVVSLEEELMVIIDVEKLLYSENETKENLEEEVA